MRNILLCLAMLGAAGAASARTVGSIEFEPCTLAPDFAPVSVDALCGTLSVPEDRAEPDGRRIELAIALVSPEGEAEPDIVFMLAGGPGQAAREAYPMVAHAFRDVASKRHVVLVDQRGTGASHPLTCGGGDESLLEDMIETTPEQAAQEARRCLSELDADVRHYTTTDAVADLDAVREALGAPQANLVGISYGTRVAQQYAMRHPDRTRSLVLAGVVPNTLALGSEHAKNLDAALDRQFALCADTPACAERFGDPRANLAALMASLEASPQPVTYRHPRTGETLGDVLRADHVAVVARMYAYLPAAAALLPLTLAEAAAGRVDVLFAQSQMLIDNLTAQINHGMQLSVMCTEDAPMLAVDPDDADTVLGTAFVEFALAQCGAWPRGDKPEDFNEPLSTDVPALLLSGELDPVTPPRYGDEVAQSLPNARHLVLPAQGHDVLSVGCTPKLVTRFLDTLDAGELDTDCLDDLPATPPFAGFYGWQP